MPTEAQNRARTQKARETRARRARERREEGGELVVVAARRDRRGEDKRKLIVLGATVLAVIGALLAALTASDQPPASEGDPNPNDQPGNPDCPPGTHYEAATDSCVENQFPPPPPAAPPAENPPPPCPPGYIRLTPNSPCTELPAVPSDDEGGGGNGGNGEGGDGQGDGEGGQGGGGQGDNPSCSNRSITQETIQLVLGYISEHIADLTPVYEMEENNFVFDASEDYYADAAIVAAFVYVGEPLDVLHNFGGDDPQQCVFTEPSQITLRQLTRARYREIHEEAMV